MHDLVTALHSRQVLVMDGAMGTEIQRRTHAANFVGYEQLNLSHPDIIRSIHCSYVEAGAEVLLTNTFQAPPTADNHQAIRQAALRLARDAKPRFVLADVGPIPSLTDEMAATIWSACGGADGILLETWSSLSDLRRIACARPRLGVLLVSFVFRSGGPGDWQTSDQATPEECAGAAQAGGAVALGVNCGKDLGIRELVSIVRRVRSACELPIFVRPNAGTPVRTDSGEWRYPTTPDKMARELPALLEEGIAMIGGCCGTTPEYVRAFRTALNEWERERDANLV